MLLVRILTSALFFLTLSYYVNEFYKRQTYSDYYTLKELQRQKIRKSSSNEYYTTASAGYSSGGGDNPNPVIPFPVSPAPMSDTNPNPINLEMIVTDAEANEIEEKLKKLKAGFLKFRCPSRMILGVCTEITCEIFTAKKFYSEDEKQDIDLIKIGNSMTVKLFGKDYEIKSKNNDSLLILPDQKTVWHWDVTPLKRGTRNLELLVTIKIKIEGQMEFYDYPIFSKIILVKNNRLFSLNRFWIKNWQWIFSTLIGSGFGIVLLKIFGFIPS